MKRVTVTTPTFGDIAYGECMDPSETIAIRDGPRLAQPTLLV